ncbi:carbohydrate ABC transporter permease [Acetatifactor aquisgranensis]|uniref:carbohydrate ABC transporter permease n=1 Tax=Acetatifactor aquisgranensis TaxID=2941233 RepID=UPI00203BCB90|nr:carbohydrate ABC transporter permease [Acetatifactor aquisgranensis]MCI8542720.1 carbohydrate ABC transporter permease [Lachnospiraceae bacterium]
MKKRQINTEKVYQAVIAAVVAILVLVSLFPLIYVAGLSFTSQQEYMSRGNLMVIPYRPTLEGYKRILFRDDTYLKGLLVSLLRTGIGTAVTLVCTLIMGYLLSKEDLPGRRGMLFAVMVTVLYNGGMIPTFLTVKGLGLLDTFWAMILPGMVDTWSVLVFKQFFSGLPKEVIESAEIDGCGELRMLVQIAVPLSTAVMAALGLFMAVGQWNAWFDALIYLQKNTDLYPLQLLLRNVFANANMGYNSSIQVDMMKNQTDTSLRMVVTMIGTVPILCVYPFLQKYFTSGVYMGAVKG